MTLSGQAIFHARAADNWYYLKPGFGSAQAERICRRMIKGLSKKGKEAFASFPFLSRYAVRYRSKALLCGSADVLPGN